MRKVLEELYYGNIEPCDRQIASNSKLRQLIKRAAECEDQLINRLHEEEQGTLDRLVTAHHEIDSIMAMENFILGFRLGIRLMAECMDENDGALTDRR